MNKILSPDKHISFLNVYHKANKGLIPLIGLSGTCNIIDNSVSAPSKMIHSFTIANISYHSYVSCSSVISDYIKHNRIELLSRTVNIKSHTIALIGFMWTIWSYNSQYND
tara:strand:+ start:1460 stop:1789 length:330 start_codon:yes stop_codon:yes gene_type:complete